MVGFYGFFFTSKTMMRLMGPTQLLNFSRALGSLFANRLWAKVPRVYKGIEAGQGCCSTSRLRMEFRVHWAQVLMRYVGRGPSGELNIPIHSPVQIGSGCLLSISPCICH
jgi:hypothetical protein